MRIKTITVEYNIKHFDAGELVRPTAGRMRIDLADGIYSVEEHSAGSDDGYGQIKLVGVEGIFSDYYITSIEDLPYTDEETAQYETERIQREKV